MSIYKLTRDIGKYKKGKIIELIDYSKEPAPAEPGVTYLKEEIFNIYFALGWLDPVEGGRWKPKDGEGAFWIDANKGEVSSCKSWHLGNNDFDDDLFNNGLIFKTREQAEEAAKKVKELLLSLHK